MYDEPGGDDYNVVEYDDGAGTGLLGTTLRNAAIIIALGLGVAWMTDGLGPGETRPFRPSERFTPIKHRRRRCMSPRPC